LSRLHGNGHYAFSTGEHGEIQPQSGDASMINLRAMLGYTAFHAIFSVHILAQVAAGAISISRPDRAESQDLALG
jgi:hypothetical protein